jgi:deoxyribodipyrimidine photo-lyase
VVGFGLTDGYPEANARHYAFMLEGLREVATDLAARGIGFVLRRGAPDTVALALTERAALVVCDRGYLRHQKAWRARVAAEAGRRVVQVEGDVVVPVDAVSDRAEPAARTLRSKLPRWRDDYLRPPAAEPVQVRADGLALGPSLALADVPTLLRTLAIDHTVAPVAAFRGGTSEARRRLAAFLDGPLAHYDVERGEPAHAQVSFLGAYLHFGQISPVEVALAVTGRGAPGTGATAYLDELIVRRELAMNFVEHAPRYDDYACLPDWARDTLDRHRDDPRPHCYDAAALEAAETHDPYWNAAMREMRATGYLHNHMRMYWGKKILEWSPTPEAGFAAVLALNNRWFLCGRDANSYANVAWCFGLHDRPWPERPIFGTVRSMTAGGLERKVDVKAYLAHVARVAGGDPGAPSAGELPLFAASDRRKR